MTNTNKNTYPVIFAVEDVQKEGGAYPVFISVPDLEDVIGAFSSGYTTDDLEAIAADLIKIIVEELEREGREVPTPSQLHKIDLSKYLSDYEDASIQLKRVEVRLIEEA